MVYDFDQADTPTVPTLADFKIRLARQMIRSAFFQDVKKEDFDMLRYMFRRRKNCFTKGKLKNKHKIRA